MPIRHSRHPPHNIDFLLSLHRLWYAYNQSMPTHPSHHYYHHIYHHHNNCTPAKVQVFFSSFHAKSAMCMHCCCLLFWTFARIKCIHHHHSHHHHSCKGNILKGSLMYQHWQIRKRPLPLIIPTTLSILPCKKSTITASKVQWGIPISNSTFLTFPL